MFGEGREFYLQYRGIPFEFLEINAQVIFKPDAPPEYRAEGSSYWLASWRDSAFSLAAEQRSSLLQRFGAGERVFYRGRLAE
jgi:hypothetical protein